MRKNPQIPMSIRGVGFALPERIMTNADFTKFLDTSDEWITTRTGIRERRICNENENTLTLATEASKKALAKANLSAEDIDLIIVATSTPFVPIPATACFLQHALGCRQVGAFDISAACSGFVYALVIGSQFLINPQYRHILVVGAETMSRITDFQDRTVCVLLGDAAGAAVISRSEDSVSGIYDHHLGADGERAKLIWVPAGGASQPASERSVAERSHYLKMNGREVYKFAVNKMQEVIIETLARAELSADELAMFIPHQSNWRIIESAREKLGLPSSKVAVNIDRYGNTSAASIPLALAEAVEAGKIKTGDWVLLAGFGAGLTWSSALIRL